MDCVLKLSAMKTHSIEPDRYPVAIRIYPVGLLAMPAITMEHPIFSITCTVIVNTPSPCTQDCLGDPIQVASTQPSSLQARKWVARREAQKLLPQPENC